MGREPTEFERVVLPHLDAAHNLARWLVRQPALADDVTQDAFVRAFRHFPSFRGGDPRAWLLRIVRNAAHTALAGTKPEVAIPDSIADPADDPEAVYRRGETAGQLDRALAALPLELRECLVLRELEECSYKQIAAITGVPVGTVMSRLWRARRALCTEGAPP